MNASCFGRDTALAAEGKGETISGPNSYFLKTDD